MKTREEGLLRAAFLAGAITDAGALLPMLSPPSAQLLWGFRDDTPSYGFAMGYGASLMLGWTVLLLWALRRPVERRFVAALTVLVICGLVLAEIVAVRAGALEAWRMVPTWCLQALLLTVFTLAFHAGTPRSANALFRFDCVFYPVSDLDRAVRFYTDVLGWPLQSRDTVARFRVDGVLFELVPTRDRSGGGNARLTLAVDDIGAATSHLADRAVPVSAARQVSNGLLASFKDPDGNELVLWQYS